MCAINGTTTSNRALVEAMNAATAHRGPDGTHVWEGKGITLGHNRLAIIDLSTEALQPMLSTDRRHVLVYNGELYNYRELKSALRDSYDFVTESDTEVLMAAYRAWGTAMLGKLSGMFAFALWDSDTETLFCARDHMGIKPFYYSVTGDVLTFSSELTPFMDVLGQRTFNREALAHYFSLQFVPSPLTLIEGVHKLPPGHMLTYARGVTTCEPYYVPERGYALIRPGDTSVSLYETLDHAVERQCIADRPIGMFLSGGLDSSIVLHHMAQRGRSVRSYSVGFEMPQGSETESDKFNRDAVLAERTAAHYGAAHTTFTLTLPELRARFHTILTSMDEPVANPTMIAQHFLSERVRADGVVVALGGDGGDELFYGYTRHRMLMAAYYFKHIPDMLQSFLGKMHPRVHKLELPFGTALHLSVMANKASLLTPSITSPFATDEYVRTYFDAAYSGVQHNHPLNTFAQIDRRTWLPEESLHRSDQTSMAHGLELRVPLIDQAVVAYADTLPVDAKLTPWQGKRILRHTYRKHLPAHLFHEPKRGWQSPGAKWLRDPALLSQVREFVSSDYYQGVRDLYHWNGLQKMLLDHIEKRSYALYPLWNSIALNTWAEKHKITL